MVARLQAPPHELFDGLTRQSWRWLHLDGREMCPFLADYLPATPGPDMEERWVGSSGRVMLAEGFDIYRRFAELYESHAGSLEGKRVLDFGCGFGRVSRFFLRDVEPENLWGLDVSEEALSFCDRFAQYRHIDPYPPTEFEACSFDLIYAFSVFSHLSEKMHLAWLAEFERLLNPEGLLILTTFRREGIVNRNGAIGECLPESEPWLSDYDRGEFAFAPLGGPRSFYGCAFIPETYARERWPFTMLDYIDAPEHGQAVIVCKR